ncbi:MAG: peptide ABC transporter ATP-binding protein [Candidatus Tectomicrobia bacterium RIFCSPLOWO2_02_FULL_70_19]|nr:MAG: peptide ABC transporter ATP-binding protein [Candidatus Tectomicrobia bacterium RIFCSPLOWO2_02_FULL_70_19]
MLEVWDLTKKFPVQAGGAVAHLKGTLRRLRGEGLETADGHWLHAVDGVSFQLERGESLGLVGESGCGKSTLARLIARLHDPTSGVINFEGEDIGAVPASRFVRAKQRPRIQMVFQDPDESLNPAHTAFSSIADPLRRLGGMRPGAALLQRVEALAAMVGLPGELLARFPHQLSGGQKARVGIARAIALEPSLLVLDEPTSALDVSVQAVILHLLEDLKHRLGMSYLFVSHDLNVVRLLCQRVLVMYLGKVAETGPTDELFERPAHPYTRALVSAVPAIDAGDRKIRLHLAGEPRSPIDPDPNVCRFYGRCPKGEARCAREMPILRRVPGGAEAACHFPEPHPRPAAARLA